MAAKTIVTHKNPHLDDVAAIWLLKRCLTKWEKAALDFVAADDRNTAMQDTDDRLHIGVGRGMFDEHKGDKNDSATTLVWKYCKKLNGKQFKPYEKRAMDELVAYVNEEDHGMLFEQQHREFMIGSVFTYLPSVTEHGSEGSVAFGSLYLDAVYQGLLEKQLLLADWKKAKSFRTRWGKGIAIETHVSSKVVARVAYSEGYTLFVYRNKRTGYLSVKARNDSRVDLTALYQYLKKEEPQAQWYLHHSKKMLICGSDVAVNTFLSNHTPGELVALLRS